QACDQTVANRIACRRQNDRNIRRCPLHRDSLRIPGQHNGVDLEPGKLGADFAGAFDHTLRRAHFERHAAALDLAEFGKPGHESISPRTLDGGRARTQQSDDSDFFGLLGAYRERQRHRRAAETEDELAPLHSITSSASASSVGGRVRPSALAVFWLTTSSNLVGVCTGMSAGLAPRKMRSA